ncbi:MAG: cytochrome P450 [Dehalococcoidia bacterium]
MGKSLGAKAVPGPRSYSPLGHIRTIQSDPIGVFMEATRRYGDLVRFRVGAWSVYLVAHPDGVRRVLQDNYLNYLKGFNYRFLRPVLGLGLLTSEGDLWQRQRRLVQPAFHHNELAKLACIMTDATAATLEGWRPRLEEGQPLDIYDEMKRLSLEVVVRTMLGSDIGEAADPVRRDVMFLREHVNHRAMRMMSLPEAFPTPRNLRFKRALRTIDNTVWGMIEERRRAGGEARDLVSILLSARDEEDGQGMSDRQLRDEVVTIFIVGHETTGTGLAWTWYLLARHPEVEEELHAELDRVLAGRVPTFADLPNLQFTKMVFQEALRLYPPAWCLGRQPIEDDEIGGFRIPAKSLVMVSPYVTHRHPDFWERPEEYDPWRFAPERSAARSRYAYIPFAAGPRGCIGDNFALMEGQLSIAMIAQQYRLRLAPGQVVEAEPAIALRPRGSLLMTPRSRS